MFKIVKENSKFKMLFFYIFFYVVIGVFSQMHNAYAAPCKAYDADCLEGFVSELVKTTLNGVPAIGVDSFDPFYMDEFEVSLANINIIFKNVTALGMKKCEVSNLRTSPGLLKYDMTCPAFTMMSNYEGNGQLSLINVFGKGEARFTTGKIVISMESDYKKMQNLDGKNYFQFKNKKFSATALEPIQIELTNLFNGQKELSDAFLKVAAINWKVLSELLLVPISRPSMEKLIKSENKYLKTMMSYEEIISE